MTDENGGDDYLETFRGEIVLTTLLWDCECEQNFIHPKSQAVCAICGAERDDQPDSHANEVLLLCPELLTEGQRKAITESIERNQGL